MPPSVAQLIGAPELDPTPAPAPAPAAAPATPQGDPAVWTVLGEAGTNPQGQLAVGSTLYNRQKALGAQSFGDVATDPANGYEAWQDPNTRASLMRQYPVGSPAYQQAQQTLSDLQAGRVAPLPYDSFYSPKAQAALGRSAPTWADNTGTNIGGNLFYGGKFTPPAGTNPVANMILTPEERAAMSGVTVKYQMPGVGGAGQPSGATPDPVADTVKFLALNGMRDPTARDGSLDNMRAQLPGDTQPPPPGDWYITPQGQVRQSGDPTPDYLPQLRQSATRDAAIKAQLGPLGAVGVSDYHAAQGLGESAMDFGHSVAKLTGGGLADAGADPSVAGGMGSALEGLNGISSQQLGSAALQGFNDQEKNYALANLGSDSAKVGRFTGQAVPATAAALAIPEIEAPAFAGRFGSIAAPIVTNALRGTAAAATNVGPNSASVPAQLAGGALAGVVLPAVTGAAGKAGMALTGLGRTVSPEVAQLADLAQTKYGINLASGQVMGASGDRGAATGYSQMLGSDAKVSAGNAAQRQQWMKGVTSIYGDPTGDVSPDALAGNRSRIGSGMDAITSRTNIAPPVADQVQTRIGQVLSDAQDTLGDDAGPLMNMAAKIGSIRNANGISGEAYQALTNQGSSLDLLMNKHPNPLVQNYAGQIRDAFDDGMQASAAPGDADAFQNLRWQYKNLQTVAKAAQNQNNIGTDGVFTPNALNAATTSNFKGRAFQGAGNLDELNAIRKAFMTEPPNSGTAGRMTDLWQTGLAGLATGGATDIGLGLLHQPEAAIPTALSAGAGALAKVSLGAMKANALGGSASNIINRSLPNAPGSALAGLGVAKKAVEVPLSALVAQRNIPAFPANTTPVGANAQ